MNSPVDISIVLAVYNEEQCIEKEIARIRNAFSSSRLTFEIIVIDDASTDSTAEILRRIQGITVIRHVRNRGAGAARKTGTLAARGEIVVWTDVDMTYPNDRIPELVGQLKNGPFRQVVGNRLAEKGSVKYLRSPAKFFLRKLASFLAKTDIPDLNSGLRAFYRLNALKFIYLVPNGFSCVSTMTLAFLCNGFEVGYMPIEYKKRVGRSKFHPITDSYNYLLQIVRMIMYFEPLRVFIPMSIIVLMTTFVKNIVDIFVTHNTQESDIVGYFVGAIIFAIGLLADLVVTQSKRFVLNDKERPDDGLE